MAGTSKSVNCEILDNDNNIVVIANHDDDDGSGEATAASTMTMARLPSLSHHKQQQHLLQHDTENYNDTARHGLFVRQRGGAVFVDEKENHRHANNNYSSSMLLVGNNNNNNNNNEGENRLVMSLPASNKERSSESLSALANTFVNNNPRMDDNPNDDKEKASSEGEQKRKKKKAPPVIMEGIRLDYFDEQNNVNAGASDTHHKLPIKNRCSSNNNDTYNIKYNEHNNNNNHESYRVDNEEREYHDRYDDDDDDDDCSEASGDTVVHSDCLLPPPNATQEEINRFYWEWCYGPIVTTTNIEMENENDAKKSNHGMMMMCDSARGSGIIRSAMRSAPSKSCLSTKKNQGNDATNLSDSVTPRRLLHHTSPSYSNLENRDDGGGNNHAPSSAIQRHQPQHQKMGDYNLSTPTDEIGVMNNGGLRLLPIQLTAGATTFNSKPKSHHLPHTTSAVKFGANSAAEFDNSLPTTEMTPIPLSVVQDIFPSNVQDDEKAQEEHGHSRETARNVAMLAEWDDDFDIIVEDSDNDDDDDDGIINHGRAIMGGISVGGSGGASYRNRASDLPGGRTMKRGRKRTPYKRKEHGSQKSHRESGSGSRRSLSSSASSRRRESSLFSRERRSLVDPDDSMDLEEESGTDEYANNMLPLYAVYIAPDEYTSPSSTSISDSVSTLGTPGVLASTATSNEAARGIPSKSLTRDGNILKPNDNHNITEGSTTTTREESQRNSLDSACISPSSLKSSLSGYSSSISTSSAKQVNPDRSSSILFGRESSDGNSDSTVTGRETPNSARTSSSTILRAVHASGALLPGISPRGGYGPGIRRGEKVVDDSSFSMEAVKKYGGGGGGRLMPNQLKYSPSSSSGESCCDDGRMHSSPSDSESLNSDIMNLFSQYNMGSTLDKRSKDHYFLLGKQLTILSEHPTHPFHTSISDLLQWSHSSSHNDKELMEFTSGILLRGLTPSTSLALIVDDFAYNSSAINGKYEPKKVYNGKTCLLLPTNFRDEQNATNATSVVQESYESILLDEVKNVCSSDNAFTLSHFAPRQDWGCATSHTISSCIQHLYRFSCMDWLSLEVDVAERTLVRLQEWAEFVESDKWISTECHRHLIKMAPLAVLSGSSNARLKLHHHRLQAQMSEDISKIALLEEQLVMEANLMGEMACIKRYLDAQLDMERFSPVSALTEEIRALILPSPIMASNGMDFSFSLLDGAAEIVLKLAVDNDHDYIDIEDSSLSTSCGNSNNTGLELGCFIKDGDGASIKLLQAILLGKIFDGRLMDSNAIYGPHMLRENLLHFISHNSRVEMLHQLTHTTSKIDYLVRSVRDLETEEDCTCHVMISSDNAKDVSLLISMPTEGGTSAGGEEIQLEFFFFINLLDKNWNVATPFLFPNHVKITLLSVDETTAKNYDNIMMETSLQRRMQENAQYMLNSINADPTLLKRICRETRQMFYR